MMKSLLLLTVLLCTANCAVWKVLVGAEGDIDPRFQTSLVQFFWYYPSSLTVNQGDTVVFQWGGPMAYTVTFASAAPSLIVGPDSQGRLYFNPQIALPTSGVIASTSQIYTSGVNFWDPRNGPGAYPSWNATFPNVGTFPYWCVFQNGMAGNIIVQPAGSAYPTTQAAIDAATQARIAQQKTLWPLAQQFYKLDRTVPFSKPHPNGVNTIWYVWAGYGDFWNRYGVNVFIPEKVTVKVGDVIVFNNADIGAHTIGINGTDGQFTYDIGFDTTTFQLYFNPVWSYPTNVPHSGQFVTGGLMLPPVVPGNTGWTWNVTMTVAGTFPVICSLHDDMGMVGTITVTN